MRVVFDIAPELPACGLKTLHPWVDVLGTDLWMVCSSPLCDPELGSALRDTGLRSQRILSRIEPPVSSGPVSDWSAILDILRKAQIEALEPDLVVFVGYGKRDLPAWVSRTRRYPVAAMQGAEGQSAEGVDIVFSENEIRGGSRAGDGRSSVIRPRDIVACDLSRFLSRWSTDADQSGSRSFSLIAADPGVPSTHLDGVARCLEAFGPVSVHAARGNEAHEKRFADDLAQIAERSDQLVYLAHPADPGGHTTAMMMRFPGALCLSTGYRPERIAKKGDDPWRSFGYHGLTADQADADMMLVSRDMIDAASCVVFADAKTRADLAEDLDGPALKTAVVLAPETQENAPPRAFARCRPTPAMVAHDLAALPAVASRAVPISDMIAYALPSVAGPQKLLIDITALTINDAKSGIQRVTRAILAELLANPPRGLRVEPIYAAPGKTGFLYARAFTSDFMAVDTVPEDDLPVDVTRGDIYLALDINLHLSPVHKMLLRSWRHRGVSVQFVMYDLLPVTLPNLFKAKVPGQFRDWLDLVLDCDGAICISRAVQQELSQYIETEAKTAATTGFSVNWFHLGSDIDTSSPSKGMPASARAVFDAAARRTTFLTVGTLEPRKAQAEILDAFEALWFEGHDVNLIIVGKQGWLTEELAERLVRHTQLGDRLFWLQGISDEYLMHLYEVASCLINASLGEGFGLPLIEASRAGLPLIVRDIPVFREVAEHHAVYFDGNSGFALKDAVEHWLASDRAGSVPEPDGMSRLTWRQSADQLRSILAKIAIEVGG